jgi:signal transduction histidine kinase
MASLRNRLWLTLALAVALEFAAMAPFSAWLVRYPQGTPGAVGVAIAVLAAIAAGPLVGLAVAGCGWLAFFMLVAEGDAVALIALPVWLLTAVAVGLVTRALIQSERERFVGELERRELNELAQLKGRFAALAAHELRTPATAVYGIVRTLDARRQTLTGPQVRELEQTLVTQSERLARLIEQLLDLSRLEAGVVAISPRPLRVRDFLADIISATETRGKEIRLDVDRDLEVEADAQALDRIVSNLVGNALTHGEAPVVVSAEQRDQHFRLRVEDRGPGVSPELRVELFSAFTRGHAQGKGSGLGLSIAKAYARAHGGDLLYQPTQPSGAQFELLLPQASARRETG